MQLSSYFSRAVRSARLRAPFALSLLLCASLLPRANGAQTGAPAVAPAPVQPEKLACGSFVPGELLVRFRRSAEVTKQTGAVTLSLAGADGAASLPVQVERFAATDVIAGLRLAHVAPAETEAALAALNARPDVLYAEPNFRRHLARVPNDPRYAEQWGLKNTSQPGVDIGAETAWATTTGSRSVVVGIVDEGLDLNHQDLRDNIWTNPADPPDGSDNDGNGFVDDLHGWDFVHDDNTVYDGPGQTPAGDPIDAHGTHVAGTVGATGDNGRGVVGVNWQVSLMALKFIGADGTGTSADLLRAFSYAKQMRDRWAASGGTQGANLRVLNNSYGGPEYSQAEYDLIKELGAAGILFVAAAGNGVPVTGSGTQGFNTDRAADYPAGYDLPNVISVAAMTRYNDAAVFTNFGARTVSLAAPGQDVLSTLPGDSYGVYSGTSMATPHVAGAAALACAAFPQVSLAALRAALLFNGDPFTAAATASGRRLRADKTLAALAENDTTPPAFVNTLRVTAQTGRVVTLNWTAPGDDGATGTAAGYEIRYSDTPAGDQLLLATARPAAAGTQQTITLTLPVKHAGGLLRLKTYDNVGNTTESVVGVAVTAATADPYSVSTSASAPLSTGGTPLQLRADDLLQTAQLPFEFPFFGRSTTSLFVSTNGALYLQTAPDFLAPAPRVGATDGAFPSVDHLNRLTMIAGLWDDLRTDRRAGDDVYYVQPDPDRVIFRWQAVTYDTLLGSGEVRGENPVNFEIELRRDGTIITRYGSGNHNVVPVVGLSGGVPDTYVVASHTAAAALRDLANAPTVLYTPRVLPPAPSADLEVRGTSSPLPVAAGQTLSYTVNVRNLGPSDLQGAGLVVQLPAGTSFLSCATNFISGTCSGPAPGSDGGTVTAAVGAFSANTGAWQLTINVRVNAAAGTTLTLTATGASARPDPNPANNTFTQQTAVVTDTGLAGVRAIFAGRDTTYAVKTDGTLWAWGWNFSGQLGDGTTAPHATPALVAGLTGVVAAANSNGHTLVLQDDGTVWTMGYNAFGQLGDGTTVERHTPVRVQGLTNVKAVGAGDFFSIALKADGTVWGWGQTGLQGNGSTGGPPTLLPVQADITNVAAISVHNTHVLARKTDGTLWAWGGNNNGQLGDTTTTFRATPVQTAAPVNLAGFAAGGEVGNGGHSVAVKADGTVLTWGFNQQFQLGYGNADFTPHPTPALVPGLSGSTAVAAGGNHTVALKTDGTVWTWGSNQRGELGDATNCCRATPAQVANFGGVIQVAAGTRHTVALKADGTVWTWGDNSAGQLGDGTTTQHATPGRVSGIPTVSAPVLNPDGGTFGAPVDVQLMSATPGALIHYRFDGLTPTELDPAVPTGGTVRVNSSVQLAARAFRADQFASSTKTALYNINGSGPAGPTLQFNQADYSANEGAGSALVTVTRTGDTAPAVAVDYATVDDPAAVRCDVIGLTAYARCDYATTLDTLTFAPGETVKTFRIPLIDDTRPEAREQLQLVLRNPTGGAALGNSSALLTIQDDDNSLTAPNPVSQTPFFVRQQYLDFLSREPETGEPWSNILTNCPDVNNTDPNSPSAGCDRILVSQSFFGSPEFRLKGYYVYLFYKVAFGRRPTYDEIVPDMRSVTGTTQPETFDKRAGFAVAFTRRPEFQMGLSGLGNDAFVAALLDRYGVNAITTPDPTRPEAATAPRPLVVLARADLVNGLSANTLTRAQVLRAVVESREVDGVEFNGAFVAMQYYGYLRRTPEAAGYQAWLDYLNAHPTDARTMVNGFMNSLEYRLRFGPEQ